MKPENCDCKSTSRLLSKAHLDLGVQRLISKADKNMVEVDLLNAAEGLLLAAKKLVEQAEENYIARWQAYWAEMKAKDPEIHTFHLQHSGYTRDRQLFLCNRCFKWRKAKWGTSLNAEDCASCFIPELDPKGPLCQDGHNDDEEEKHP